MFFCKSCRTKIDTMDKSVVCPIRSHYRLSRLALVQASDKRSSDNGQLWDLRRWISHARTRQRLRTYPSLCSASPSTISSVAILSLSQPSLPLLQLLHYQPSHMRGPDTQLCRPLLPRYIVSKSPLNNPCRICGYMIIANIWNPCSR